MNEHELPVEIDVEEELTLGFFSVSFGQLGYVVAGVVLGIIVSGIVGDVPPAEKFWSFVAPTVLGVLAALVRPYGRGLIGWVITLVAFLKNDRQFIWWPNTQPLEKVWGVGQDSGLASMPIDPLSARKNRQPQKNAVGVSHRDPPSSERVSPRRPGG